MDQKLKLQSNCKKKNHQRAKAKKNESNSRYGIRQDKKSTRRWPPMYYRGAAAAILVYDITHRGSFLVLKQWAEEISEKGPPGIVLAVCANKSDLAEERQISLHEAKQFAEGIGALYIETSARDDSNVLALFVELGKRLPDATPTQTDENGGMGNVDLGQRRSRKTCCYA